VNQQTSSVGLKVISCSVNKTATHSQKLFIIIFTI